MLDKTWRLFATGLSFALFGLGGLVLGLFVFPVLWLVVRRPDSRRRIARWLMTGGFWMFTRTMAVLGVLRFRIRGLEYAKRAKGCLIAANHPSLIDVVFLLSIFRDAECVVKHTMWSNPFTMITLRVVDYIANKEPDVVMAECVKRLQAGNNLILFPETTRTTPGKPMDFKRGATTIAVRACAPCLPVAIRCTPTTLTKAEHWYDIPEKKVLFELTVLEPVPSRVFLEVSGNERQASKDLNAHLHKTLFDHLEIMNQNS